jgi:hypothetical protein
VEKSIEDFPPRTGAGKIKRRRMCQACRNAADYAKSKRWAEANPEAARERYRRYDQRHNAARRARWHMDPEYRERNKAAAKRWRARNRETYLPKLRDRHRQLRRAVIELYGRACACCGESTVEFLAIDHVNGGGNQARKAGELAATLCRKLLEHGQPHPDYRLLCHNCNSALGYYGYCPHQAPTDEVG